MTLATRSRTVHYILRLRPLPPTDVTALRFGYVYLHCPVGALAVAGRCRLPLRVYDCGGRYSSYTVYVVLGCPATALVAVTRFTLLLKFASRLLL